MVKVKGQVITDEYALYNDDCIQIMKGVESDTVGLSVFSPPFQRFIFVQ